MRGVVEMLLAIQMLSMIAALEQGCRLPVCVSAALDFRGLIDIITTLWALCIMQLDRLFVGVADNAPYMLFELRAGTCHSNMKPMADMFTLNLFGHWML